MQSFLETVSYMMFSNCRQLVSKPVLIIIYIKLLVKSGMVSSYEEKVIIKYLRIKYKYGAARIVSNHPEQELNVNGVKELLNKIDGAGDIV